MTVTGKTIGENIEGAHVHLPDVIHSLNDPIYAEGATAVLKGNLAPNGCVIKPAAADPRFLKHRGKAIAFDDYNHMMQEIERDDLDVTPDHILVLKNAGPKGGPGMPEWGTPPIPKRLLGQGVRDMIRISDGRMSGTSYGACILHVAPESFVGGPLNFVQTGDEIEIDVDQRSIHLHVSDAELARRKAAWKQPAPKYQRGYGAMFSEHIGQADQGCDFDFLQVKRRCPSRRFIEFKSSRSDYGTCNGFPLAMLQRERALRHEIQSVERRARSAKARQMAGPPDLAAVAGGCVDPGRRWNPVRERSESAFLIERRRECRRRRHCRWRSIQAARRGQRSIRRTRRCGSPKQEWGR